MIKVIEFNNFFSHSFKQVFVEVLEYNFTYCMNNLEWHNKPTNAVAR